MGLENGQHHGLFPGQRIGLYEGLILGLFKGQYGLSEKDRFQTNIFLGIYNSNWSNANNWSLRHIPLATENAIIAVNCSLNQNATVKKLIINASVLFVPDSTARTMTVNESIYSLGKINLGFAAHNLVLNGSNNFINYNGFTSGTTSTVTYSKVGDQPIVSLAYYNLTILNSGTKINAATIVNGLLTVGNNFSGNVSVSGSVECRGGVVFSGSGSACTIDSVSFTTNNQSISSGSNGTISNINVIGSIILTNSNVLTCNFISGSVSGSTFINSNTFNYTGSTEPYLTGTINLTTNPNTFNYTSNSNQSAKDTTYYNLGLSGSGTKTFSAILTVNNSFTATSTTISSVFNFIMNGAYNITFSTTNVPQVECRAGGTIGNTTHTLINHTTANQTLTVNNCTINTITITGAITVIYSSSSNTVTCASLNGTVSGSTFDCRVTGSFTYTGASAPMSTGAFKTDQSANTFVYNLVGAQAIRVPDDSNYRNLTLTGNTSTKTVGGVAMTNARGTYTVNTGVTVVGVITNNP